MFHRRMSIKSLTPVADFDPTMIDYHGPWPEKFYADAGDDDRDDDDDHGGGGAQEFDSPRPDAADDGEVEQRTPTESATEILET